MAGCCSRRDEWIGSWGQVVVLDFTILWISSEEREMKWVKTEGSIGGGMMSARVKEEQISFPFFVKLVTNVLAVREG